MSLPPEQSTSLCRIHKHWEGGREGGRRGGREDREEGVEFEEKRESYIIIGLKLVGPWENLTYLDNFPRPNPNQKPTQVQYMYNKK